MPQGFIGGPAVKYIAEVVEVLSTSELVLRRDPFARLSNRAVPPPALPVRTSIQPPYQANEARSGSGSTGVGNSSNIVLGAEGYDEDWVKLQNINNEMGEHFYRTIMAIENLCETSFRLPQVVPMIMITLMAYRNMLGDFRSLTDETLSKMRGFADEILNMVGGSPGGFVWNASGANGVRVECETSMRQQSDLLRETASHFRSLIPGLTARAQADEHISRTAMRTVWGRYNSWQVPDVPVRTAAANRASSLREQISLLESGATDLTRAVEEVQIGITESRKNFETWHEMAQSTDSQYASQQEGLNEATNSLISYLDSIADSIHDCFPIYTSGNLFDALGSAIKNTAIEAIIAARLSGIRTYCALGGDPVNMSTGNFVYYKDDITVGGKYPLTFKRFYNAIDATDSVMGVNWTHNFNIRLMAEENHAHIAFDDGHIETFEHVGSYYITSPDSQNILAKTESGWQLIMPDMSSHWFDENGLLVAITDRDGNRTELTHKDELLERVETPSGHLEFVYTDGLLTEVTDHTGRKVSFEYADKRLIKVTHPTEAEHHYRYDLNGKISEILNPLDVTTVRNEYDSYSRMKKQYMPDGGIMEYAYNDEARTTTLTQQNGSKVVYKYDEKHRTTGIAYPDGEEIFEYNANSQRTLAVDKLGNKTRFGYDKLGNLSVVTNALGIKTRLHYSDENNQLSRVSIDGQTKIKNTYDKNGNIIVIEDALKNKTSLSYLENGIPETITQPDGSQIQLTYDERRNITKMVDGSGVVTEYRYDELNRVITSIDGNGNETHYQYDVADNITEVKNATGDVRSYVYNKSNKVTKITDFDGNSLSCEYNVLNKPSKLTDQLGRETRLNYDLMWNVERVVEPNGAESKFSYDASNRLEQIEKPDGSKLCYQYDANGNRTGVTDEAGNQTKFTYDALGQLIEVTGAEGANLKYEYNAEGQVTRISDALGHEVTLSYNAAGQLIEEKNPLGDRCQYAYTSLGKVSTATDESGLVTRYEYEVGGRLSNIHHTDRTTESYSYDAGGNIQKHTTRTGQVLSYEYDSLNRIVKITNSDEGSKQYSYDAISNVTSMTDENGHSTVYEYTLTGQLSKVTDALGNIAEYTYDERDQLIEVMQSAAASLGLDADLEKATAQNAENKELHITRYKRNPMGQVDEITDALGGKESYEYDVKGQLIEKIDKDGYLTKYGYTANGDVRHIQYADGREVKLSYNPLRQLTEVEDWLGITKIELDALGRATKVTNHQEQVVSYQWGNASERRGIIYPNGKQVTYEYDSLLRLAKVDDGDIQTSYHYDEYSRLTEKLFSNGTKTQYQYNPLGHLQELSHWNTDGLLDKYQYEYDLMGNKTGITKERKGLADESGAYGYTYDPLNRLQDIQKDGKLLRSYEYDAYGNRAKMVDGSVQTSYVYNALNQLISTADTSGTEQRYRYDKRGNLTEIHKNGTLANQYHFGTLNRLESAFNFEKNIGATYSYNGLGHRVGKTEGTSIEPILPTVGLASMSLSPTKQIDDVLDLTRQYHNLLERSENSTTTSFAFDFGVLSAHGVDGSKNYLLDDLGSPVRLLDGVGAELNVFGYDEFGVALGQHSADRHFGFTGYQADAVTGMWYAQAREYDAKIGRFVSEDLIVGFSDQLQSLNRYTYCWNQPIDFMDVDGLLLRRIGNWVSDRASDVWDGVSSAANTVGQFIQDNSTTLITAAVVIVCAVAIVATAGAATPLAAAAIGTTVKALCTAAAVGFGAGFGVGAGINIGSQLYSAQGSFGERIQQVDWVEVGISGTAVGMSSAMTVFGVPAPIAFGVVAGAGRDAVMQARNVDLGNADSINPIQVVATGLLTGVFTKAGEWVFRGLSSRFGERIGALVGSLGNRAGQLSPWLGRVIGAQTGNKALQYIQGLLRGIAGLVRNQLFNNGEECGG